MSAEEYLCKAISTVKEFGMKSFIVKFQHRCPRIIILKLVSPHCWGMMMPIFMPVLLEFSSGHIAQSVGLLSRFRAAPREGHI
jgi:hypothetical protein